MLMIHLSNALQSLDVNTKQLVGEVMTHLEAALVDQPEKLTPLKTSIKRAIWRKNQDLQALFNSVVVKQEDEGEK